MNLKEETKKLHDRNYQKYGLDLNVLSAIIALIFVIAFIFLMFFTGESFYTDVSIIQEKIVSTGSIFMIVCNLLIVIAIILIFSPLGKIKLGKQDEKPEFSNFSWYSMLFSAGMGIGLLFYGVAEPMWHLGTTLLYEGSTPENAALATTYFDWAIHGWVIYAIMGLSFAFYAYNLDLPLSPRSLFYPLLKDHIFGRIGDVIDGLAIVLTLFALAASLGIGSLQITNGLNYLFDTSFSTGVQVLVIIIITFFATISVVTGLTKGVRILSEINLKLMLLLAIFILLLGPTKSIFIYMFSSTFDYISGIIPASLAVNQVDSSWAGAWPIFYMAWWMSWSIFVGMFIAKISRGRTIRNFLVVVVLVPTALSIFWFAILGTTAFELDASSGGVISNAINADLSTALFALNEVLITNGILLIIVQVVTIVLIVNFFITSSDSGSLVIDGLASGGTIKSPKGQKIFWACLEGVLAICILIIGGESALNLINKLLVIVAYPFAYVIAFTVGLLLYALVKYYYRHLND